MGLGASIPIARSRDLAIWVSSVLAASQHIAADTAHYRVFFKISDPVIEPGEHQTIELWGQFHGEWSDGLGGEWFGAPGFMLASEFPVKYYSLGYFFGDVINTKHGETGVFGSQLYNGQLAAVPGTVTSKNDILLVGGLAGVPPSPFVLTGNPVFLWSVDWTPTRFEHRTVSFDFVPGAEYGVIAGWWQGSSWVTGPRKVPTIGDSISFKVIPAPSGWVAFLAAATIRQRRRR